MKVRKERYSLFGATRFVFEFTDKELVVLSPRRQGQMKKENMVIDLAEAISLINLLGKR